MVWEELASTSRGLQAGIFVVRRSPNLNLPASYQGKNYTIFVDRAKKVVKLQFMKNGIKTMKKTFCMPKVAFELIEGVDSYIALLEENAMYFCRYKDGQEQIEKVLKTEK